MHDDSGTARTCVQCHGPLSGTRAVDKLCERCHPGALETVRLGAVKARTAAPDGFQPGDAVARFQVVERLGQGGTSDVYRVRDESNREFALKVAKYVPTRPSEHLTLQQNELEVLRRLRHRSLVTVHEGGFLEDGRLYILMEIVEGVRLCDALATRGRFDLLEAIGIVRQVLDALAYCHDMGVLHLDLKPNNIIVVEPHEPRLKVLDFGLSRMQAGWENRNARVVAGTPGYMAPECITGRRDASGLDERADLYAIGVILFELMTGQLPFRLGESDHIAIEQLTGSTARLRGLGVRAPRRLQQLLDNLLAPDPARRYPSAARLSRELRGIYYATLSGELSTAVLAQSEELETGSDEAPFVGREQQLVALRRAFAEATDAGTPRTLLIVGEPGVGKSRLVAEFLASLRGGEPSVFAYGRCPEVGGLVPYAPFRMVLAELGHALGGFASERAARICAACAPHLGADFAVLQSLAPELAELLLPASAELTPLSRGPRGHARIERTVEVLATVLRAVASELPLVVMIEDLHWADAGTAEVLRHLGSRTDLGGLLLLVTTRPPGPLGFAEHASTIVLPLLDSAANDELLYALVGRRDAQLIRELKQTVPVLASGIPLFNRQVLRHLEDEGYLLHERGGTVVLDPKIHAYQPPDSVPAVLARTLDQLPERTLFVLSIAARFGRQSRVSDLSMLGLFEEAEVEAAFELGEQRGLCARRGDVVSFVHDAMRAQLGEWLPESVRPSVHARVAEQLRRAGAPSGTLAFHLEQSNQSEAAARAHVQASLDAERLNDPLGACQELERAIDLILPLARDEAVDGILLEALFQLARIGSVLGRHERALMLLERCAARLGAEQAACTPALSASFARVYYIRGDFANALSHSRHCLVLCGDDPAKRIYQCGPANVLGRALCASGRFGQAVELLARGCELADETQELIELSHSQGLLGTALAYTGRFEEAEHHISASRALAHGIADPVRVLGAYFYEAALAEARLDWRSGLAASAGLLAAAEECQLGGLYLYLGTMFAGRHSYHAGHLARARVLLCNALNLAEVLHMTLGVGWAHAYLGDVHFAAASFEDAQAAYRNGLRVGQNGTGDEYALPMCQIGLAHCASQVGPASSVIEPAELAIATLRRTQNRTTLHSALERYIEALRSVGETRRAEQVERERVQLAQELELEGASWRPARPSWTEVQASAPDDTLGLLLHGIDPKAKTLSMSQRLAHVTGYVPEYIQGGRT